MATIDLTIAKKKLLANRRIDKNGCWIWTGHKKNGKFNYGFTCFGTMDNGGPKNVHVHRIAAAIWLGLDLDDTDTHSLHRCDNPPCFNPLHLFLGTNKDNVADRHAKGRTNPARGERVNTAKLTADKVRRIREIKRTTGKFDAEIGAMFGITQAMTSRIIRRTAWRHVQ